MTKSLLFPEAAQGDGPYRVLPGKSDNASNACFKVSGPPKTEYTFLLPHEVRLRKTIFGTIPVSNFESSTASGIFEIEPSGEQFVFVGATRASISPIQSSGEYTANFCATVRLSSGIAHDSACTDVAQAIIKVLSVTNLSDLDFGESVAGDPSSSVPPGNTENLGNGSFRITGEPDRVFNIGLPIKILLSTQIGGGSKFPIPVTDFKSFPDRIGVLDKKGHGTLFVGAMRAALPPQQSAGSYSGSYAVSVVY